MSDSRWISDVANLSPELRALDIEFCALKDRDAMASVNVMPNTMVYRLFSLLSDTDSSIPTLPLLSTIAMRAYGFSTDELWLSIARDMAARFLSMVEYRVDEVMSLRHAELVVTPNSKEDRDGPVREVWNNQGPEPEVDVIRRRCEALQGNAGLTCILDIPGLGGL
ncbi:hypothetical protein PQX77_016671 [Marasmius sp. AFHP31]|nr:hypothetical protein PQX77_016671 [Marasmius sp. AFHP31]